jgi:cell division protease FtsH
MVRELGMSEAAGPLAYAGDAGEDWHPSEEARRLVDAEARRLAEEASAEASAILSAHRSKLERVAEALLERESLSVGELVQLVGTTPLADRKRLRETADDGKFGGPISGDGSNLR